MAQYSNHEYNYDGPTILYILMALVNPNMRVGDTDLKETIWLVNMGAFNHNMKDLHTDIELNYNLIAKQDFLHGDTVIDILNTLLTGKNSAFNACIKKDTKLLSLTAEHHDLKF